MLSFSHCFQILLGFLLINYHCNCAQKTEGFKPVSGNDVRITEIQVKLLKVQIDIISLNSAITTGDSSNVLKTRLTALESQFQILTEKLADERRQDSESIGKYDTAIALLTTQHNSLQTQLTSLQTTITAKIKVEQERSLPDDIQDAIRTHKFKRAEEKLIELNDNDQIQGIVHKVYANSLGNFDVIMDFSKAVRKITFQLAVFKALRYEIRANGHNNPYKLIEMVKALQDSIVSDDNALEDQKSAGRTMINETTKDLINASAEIFKQAMHFGTYANNVEIEKLSDALNSFRPDLLEEVILMIVDGSFASVASGKILDNLYSHKNISQTISGIVALFYKLESTVNFNNETMINMGDYLKKLQDREAYKTISAAQLEAVIIVISKLPTCVRSMFFEPHVCFHSRDDNVDGGSSSSYQYSDSRRHVYTWFPGYQLTDGGWIVTRSGDKFYFENREHPKNFLYIGDIDYNKRSRHYVYATKVDGDLVDNKGAWNIQLNGEFCYLKNVDNNEYMFAAIQHSRSRRRFAFTWVPDTSVRSEEFQWQLRKCK